MKWSIARKRAEVESAAHAVPPEGKGEMYRKHYHNPTKNEAD